MEKEREQLEATPIERPIERFVTGWTTKKTSEAAEKMAGNTCGAENYANEPVYANELQAIR